MSQNNGTLTAFAYDRFGNLVTKAEDDNTQTVLRYDAGGRLTSIDPAGADNTVSFGLDALGRFKSRTAAGVTATYRFAGTSEAVTKIDLPSGTDTDALVDPDGARLGLKAGSLRWALFDQLGSTAALIDGSRLISDAYRYEGWAEPVAVSGSTSNPWRFRGLLDLGTSGATPLYDMGARAYAPSLGAFSQLDTYAGTAADPLSMNRYLYAQANPATLIDPTGHCARYGADGGLDILGTISGCAGDALGFGAGMAVGAGEAAWDMGAGAVDLVWSVPGRAADAGRCALDVGGCLVPTAQRTVEGVSDLVTNKDHARDKVISEAAFGLAEAIGKAQAALTNPDPFQRGKAWGGTIATVEILGLGPKVVGATKAAVTSGAAGDVATAAVNSARLAVEAKPFAGVVNLYGQFQTTRLASQVNRLIARGTSEAARQLRAMGAAEGDIRQAMWPGAKIARLGRGNIMDTLVKAQLRPTRGGLGGLLGKRLLITSRGRTGVDFATGASRVTDVAFDVTSAAVHRTYGYRSFYIWRYR